ncbi:hypothetical protein Rsub_03059 [Raphidocelis subcapitata]|uniref:PHD-type domain-containing protein n=1 Tax=Raphidocelis subcapitata TaxID=307507 RepID=A0A2V0NSV4_9CHLO|nr:hypothetical protein Rsub_03059 [Raphidocelis subcapitata]|eukprot:GBF90758.1 hypothetical protein Rsub_03059 [Raphidocelis subcapitata]
MRTPQELFSEYSARRSAILRALTTDVDRLVEQCDPARENLSLYGYADGSWAVELPVEEVPPEVPEPALGINFARDGLQRQDWLALVAVHSDSWLLSLAFYKAARFNREQREELFHLINSLPTCYEVVSGRALAGAADGGGKRRAAASGRPPKQAKHAGHDDDDGSGGEWQDGEGDPCPMCGHHYQQDEFWIACDDCDRWFCGRCTKMTAAKAEKMGKWFCNACPVR